MTSAVGLGCMGMCEFWTAGFTANFGASVGFAVTHFDSADTYGLGHNESLLGRFIAQGGASRVQQVILATKFTQRPGCTVAAGIGGAVVRNGRHLRPAAAPSAWK